MTHFEREVYNMKVGYIRVSTKEQNEERQVRLLNEHGVEKAFVEKISGKNADREQLKEMINFAREGDVVYTESISRIARNTKDLLNIIETLTEKGVEFVSVKENIDTTTPTGKFMLTVFGALATLERETILERQAEGIAIAKEQGKFKGKQPIKVDVSLFDEVMKKWNSGEITGVQAQKELGLKPNTFYRRAKEYNNEHK